MLQTFGRVLLGGPQLQLLSIAARGGANTAAAAAAAASGGRGLLACIRCFSTEEGSKRLYVGNLSWQTEAEDLKQHFGQYGAVQECTVVRDRFGRSKGFAFVEMPGDVADEAVSKTDAVEFQGRMLRVNVAREPLHPGERQGGSGGAPRERRHDGGGGRGWRGGGDDGGQQEQQHFEPREGCRRLYLGNLPYAAKAHDLAELLGKYGRVEDVMIPLDDLGRSRGYAFVELDAEGAEAVLNQVDQTEVMGRQVFVRAAHSVDDARTRRRGGGRGGRGGGYDDSSQPRW